MVGGTEWASEKLPNLATLARGRMVPAKDQRSCCQEDPLNDS